MKRWTAILLGVVMVGLALLVSACGGGGGAEQGHGDRGLTVGVTILPQHWLIEQIAGDRVEVIVLVRPDESPASYQPGDREIARLSRAAAYFRIGVPCENGPWFEALRNDEDMIVVDTRQGIELRHIEAHHHAEHEDDGHDHAHHGEGNDPHIWLSPRLLKQQARTIAEALIEIDREHESTYTANLAALEAHLEEIDATIRRMLADLENRTFLVFHPAWGYFADEYNLRQVAIEIEGREPTDREMTELQQLARQARINVVFVQPQIDGSSASAVAGAIGARVRTFDPLAPDVAENLVRFAEALVAAESR